MKKNLVRAGLLLLVVGAAALAGACASSGTDDAAVSFSLTDAPDTSGLTNVFVTVSELKVNEAADAADGPDGSWKSVALDPAREFDLLTLTNGVRENIGELTVPGGTQINQIRLVVASARVSDDNDATSTPLSVPSDSVKLVNSFQVPLSGTLGITLDFDVRKSVVKTGEGSYILKPAIRVVLDNEAGWITGTTNPGAFVYLYEDGVYVEGAQPTAAVDSDADGIFDVPAFPDACTSTVACAAEEDSPGTFKLAFLDPGTYDIVVQLADGSAHQFFDLDLVVSADAHTAAGDVSITAAE